MKVYGKEFKEFVPQLSIKQFAEVDFSSTLKIVLQNPVFYCIEVPVTDEWLASRNTMLTEAQLERSERFKHQGAKKQFLTAHLALHLFLRGCLDKDYKHIAWNETEYHKPYINLPDGSRPLEFNLSHCRNWIALIIGPEPVGIDIEGHRPMDSMKGVSELVYTKNERGVIFSNEEGRKIRQFFRHWSCKEAFLKAEGTGFMREPKTLEMDFSSQQPEGAPLVWWSETIPDHTLAWTIRPD